MSDLSGIITFLQRAEAMKNTLRSGYTSDGRTESVAEHTWRLTLMVTVLGPEYPDVDIAKLLKMCIVHDLGEALNGDIPAPEQVEQGDKPDRERADLLDLTDTLPPSTQAEVVALWDEYEAAETREARLAKAFDKLETILQHNQGQNPPDFDYAFNLDYGAEYTNVDALIKQFRTVLDKETARLAGTD
ncbi:phosphohydrolase [Longibacter salinarum]|uniref:5'-deoxynucleotidase n=1 Tax=Longibacter salinarum TaxID=1850348 RepID=A0A2A8CYE2_9BACT|nr:HD domain-containing protein [Longibacter salinarum]PEN13650.1 phosphohydrolase [Longibacter salinarum]